MHKQYPRYRMGAKPFNKNLFPNGDKTFYVFYIYSTKNVFRKNHRNIINKSAHSIHNLTLRGRGVDITEGSCTEIKYIGRVLQTATNLICCKEE
jgi:hypothetical protein